MDHLPSNDGDIYKAIPKQAFKTPVTSLKLSNAICTLLQESGFEIIGDLFMQMETNPEKIQSIKGIGPKAIQEIKAALKKYTPKKIGSNSQTYSLPVTSLADYYQPPDDYLNIKNNKSQKQTADKTVQEYNPPVPSLADYFVPQIRDAKSAQALHAETIKKIVKQKKHKKKQNKNKRKGKKLEPKEKKKKKKKK